MRLDVTPARPCPQPHGHLLERVVEKLGAFGLPLGWHHRHQKFLMGLKLKFIFLPWG